MLLHSLYALKCILMFYFIVGNLSSSLYYLEVFVVVVLEALQQVLAKVIKGFLCLFIITSVLSFCNSWQ